MRLRSMIVLSFLIAASLPALAWHSAGTYGQAPKCEASALIRAEPPRDPDADPFGDGPWYINEDRTIWAGWDASRLHAGRNKVLWIRPAGTRLRVEGERIDRAAPPLVATIRGYSTSFQASILLFPTEGCWRVRATAGNHELIFHTNVGLGQPSSAR